LFFEQAFSRPLRNSDMLSEIHRPLILDEVVGHTTVKQRLISYLTTKPYSNVLVLHGSPGIGKTTMALASIRTCGMEPLEINATQTMRSHEDVARLVSSYQSRQSILSLIRGDTKSMCLLLDEIDGSDSHAQRKLVEWMISADRKLPILMTCNEVPRIFKSSEKIEVIRCYPPKPAELSSFFPNSDVQTLAVQCQHDVRRMVQSLQYGMSETLPSPAPLTKFTHEVNEIVHQKHWVQKDPLIVAHEYRRDRLGSVNSSQTNP